MADKSGLKFLGFAYGGITVAVAIIASFVVMGHLDGRIVDTAYASSPVQASLVQAAR